MKKILATLITATLLATCLVGCDKDEKTTTEVEIETTEESSSYDDTTIDETTDEETTVEESSIDETESVEESTEVQSGEATDAESEKESETEKESVKESETEKESEPTVDVDLTALSATMVYSEVYNMCVDPQSYVGKVVKMKGTMTVYPGELRNYYACVISDATACCQQGLEFLTINETYPEANTEITVTGTFEIYYEGS